MIEATIGAYCDYFSFWYGLKDGTMLDMSDEQGSGWVKIYDRVMTVEEFNASQENDGN